MFHRAIFAFSKNRPQTPDPCRPIPVRFAACHTGMQQRRRLTAFVAAGLLYNIKRYWEQFLSK